MPYFDRKKEKPNKKAKQYIIVILNKIRLQENLLRTYIYIYMIIGHIYIYDYTIYIYIYIYIYSPTPGGLSSLANEVIALPLAFIARLFIYELSSR